MYLKFEVSSMTELYTYSRLEDKEAEFSGRAFEADLLNFTVPGYIQQISVKVSPTHITVPVNHDRIDVKLDTL